MKLLTNYCTLKQAKIELIPGNIQSRITFEVGIIFVLQFTSLTKTKPTPNRSYIVQYSNRHLSYLHRDFSKLILMFMFLIYTCDENSKVFQSTHQAAVTGHCTKTHKVQLGWLLRFTAYHQLVESFRLPQLLVYRSAEKKRGGEKNI